MKKWLSFGLLILLSAGIAVIGVGPALLADDDAAIDSVMKAMFKKNVGVHPKLAKELGNAEVNWAEAGKLTASYVKNAEALTKTKVPHGEAKSWETLTKAFLADSKELDAATGTKEKANADKALKKINGSCQPCHDAHRE